MANSPSVRDAINAATHTLKALSPTARLDTELLMAYALGVTREALLLGRMEDTVPPVFATLVERRSAHEPIAYITGTRAFWTIELTVAPGVLIPRADSETLIEAAVAHFGVKGPGRILDLGTGSGALLLAALAEWPAATGLGVDRSPAALAIAQGNAERLGLVDRAEIREGDWAEGIGEAFDLVLCNPPYIESDAVLGAEVAEHEPSEALYAGPDGLADYRRLAPELARLIAPGGMAAIEIGATQAEAVRALLADQGLDAAVRRDLAGRDRCVAVTR